MYFNAITPFGEVVCKPKANASTQAELLSALYKALLCPLTSRRGLQ
jgi:hypothetical protein